MMAFLPARPWTTDRATRAVMAALASAGGVDCARFVGGCVRDTLIGRDAPDLDIDIATRLTPQDVISALSARGLRVEPTGIEHGVVTAIAFGRPFEISTLRRDVETDGRRAVVAFTSDWAEDAARRDFTMNALYAGSDGRLYDPTGQGLTDAVSGRVVFVGDPDIRIQEDYLRILRFFRFLAHYAKTPPDQQALTACARRASRLSGLSAERVARELLKLLSAPDPRAAIESMRGAGVLLHISPELSETSRLLRLIELERQLDRPGDPELRLAAWCPDNPPQILDLVRRLKLSNALRDRLVAASPIRRTMRVDVSDREMRQALWRLGETAGRDQLLLSSAASREGVDGDQLRRRLDHISAWRRPEFPISGDDILALGVKQGPRVGQLRRSFEDWWIDQDFPEDRQTALDKLKRIASSEL